MKKVKQYDNANLNKMISSYSLFHICIQLEFSWTPANVNNVLYRDKKGSMYSVHVL